MHRSNSLPTPLLHRMSRRMNLRSELCFQDIENSGWIETGKAEQEEEV